MRTATLALVLVFAATASAQSVKHESVTGTPWSHTTSGTWKNGIADPRSPSFKKLDHLVSATSFSYSRAPLTLGPGTYVADIRFAKVTNATGAAPITLRAIANGLKTVVTPVADQKVDTFVHNKALMFTLTATTPVVFSFFNTNSSVTKLDYLFDSFHLGKVVRGRAVLVESVTRRWGHAWGAPHWCKEHADATAQFGFVERLNPRWSSNCGSGSANLWWFAMSQSGTRTYLPGLHSWNLRMKKTGTVVGAHDMDIWIRKSTDKGTTWTNSAKVVWKAVQHTPGKWLYTPNYPFNVTSPTHLYSFRMSRTSGSFKADYHFDSCEVRRGEYSNVGKSCLNGGKAELNGNIPQLSLPFNVEVGPLGTNTNPVTLIIGLANPNIDLSALGWNGCYQHARLDLQVGMPVKSGVAALSIPMPSSTSLIGVKWWTQAYQATTTGLQTSNGMRGTIGN